MIIFTALLVFATLLSDDALSSPTNCDDNYPKCDYYNSECDYEASEWIYRNNKGQTSHGNRCNFVPDCCF